MRFGIGLPTWLGNLVSARELIDWARRAESAGFEAVGVHDRPNSDTWEPLATLAAIAAVTERIRLATTAVILPTRDEALLVKLLTRYYRSLPRPFRSLVSVGDDRAIAATIEAYRDAGLDLLYLVPVARSADQVERIAAVVVAGRE